MFWPYWLSYFAVIAVTSNTGLKLVTPKKCEIEEKHGVFYSPKASHLYGKIIKSYNSINETECRRICCGLWNCTLYMYSTIVLDVSCFLIFCENKSLCLTKPLPKNASGISVVGIKQDDFPNLRTFNSSGKNLTVKQANPNIIPSISRTVIPNTHTESLGLHPNTVLSQSSGKLRDLNSSPPLPNVLHASTSPVKQNSKRKFSENHSHTTPVSLVIALIIGVLFFGTVAFLIGRRWSESCFRRGYSRVDYLLNDYD